MNQKIKKGQYWIVKKAHNEAVAEVIGINQNLNHFVVNEIDNRGNFSNKAPIVIKDFKTRVSSEVAKKIATKYAENKINRHLHFK